MPGALSAVGILLADAVRDHSRTVMLPGDALASLAAPFAEMESRAAAEFAAEGLHGVPQRSLDLRYRHQGYELNVPYDPQSPEQSLAAFHQLHQQRYGFADPQRPIEIVNLRLRMVAAAEPYVPVQHAPRPGDGSAACYATRPIYFDGQFVPARLYRRDALVPGDILEGPAMITEYTAATILPPGATARVDAFANLILTVTTEPHA